MMGDMLPKGYYGPYPQGQPGFMQQFQQNKGGDPDKTYNQYLSDYSRLPPVPAYQPRGGAAGFFDTAAAGVRRAVPFMDTAQGHRDLQNSLNAYPFTPGAKQQLSKDTVVRDYSTPEVEEEEGDTNPEKYLGIHTGRDLTKIATKLDYSPGQSVMTHELMHSYLDKNGFPHGEQSFNQDWEAAKKTSPILQQIDQFVATSPDYKDEQDYEDISQERFAYLAQALSGGGLNAFPPALQKHYAPIFQSLGKGQ